MEYGGRSPRRDHLSEIRNIPHSAPLGEMVLSAFYHYSYCTTIACHPVPGCDPELCKIWPYGLAVNIATMQSIRNSRKGIERGELSSTFAFPEIESSRKRITP